MEIWNVSTDMYLMYYQHVCRKFALNLGVGIWWWYSDQSIRCWQKICSVCWPDTGVSVSLVVNINLYIAFENNLHLSSWTIAMKCQCYNASVLSGGVARRSNLRHAGTNCCSMESKRVYNKICLPQIRGWNSQLVSCCKISHSIW